MAKNDERCLWECLECIDCLRNNFFPGVFIIWKESRAFFSFTWLLKVYELSPDASESEFLLSPRYSKFVAECY